MMRNLNMKNIALCACLVFGIVLSMLIISPYVSSKNHHEEAVASIDAKINTVMELTAASTAASAAISAMPGDTATPVAEKLADFSTYFLLVLCALYLEKYLVTVTGFAAFGILIPLALAVGLVSMFWRPEVTRRIAVKMSFFALAIWLIIPVSMKVSDMIFSTYENSIEATISDARESADGVDGIQAEDSDQVEGISGAISSFVDTVTNKASDLTENATNILNHFIEALAVMIVTSCLIPILVIFVFIWIIRYVLNIDAPIYMRRMASRE